MYFSFIVAAVLWIGMAWLVISLIRRRRATRAAHDRLRATGTKAVAKILSVGAGRQTMRQGSMRIYTRPLALAAELPGGTTQIEVDIVVPEMMVAGAPCELVIDPADHKRVCITAIGNSFGVNTPVELGSLYSRW